MQDGWIKLYRQLLFNDLWEDKPFGKGQAWVDLLLSANHKDKTFLLGREVVSVEKGGFITSIKKLAERWGWSRHKVSDFLNILETDYKMIEQKKDTKRTYLKITNYAEYQELEKQQKDTQGTSKGHQKDTNKNEKKEKNNITLLHKVILEGFSENQDLEPILVKWLDYKKAKKQAYKDDKSISALIKNLIIFSGGNFEKAQAVVDNAMANNWAGLYPLKDDKKQTKKTASNTQEVDYEARARD